MQSKFQIIQKTRPKAFKSKSGDQEAPYIRNFNFVAQIEVTGQNGDLVEEEARAYKSGMMEEPVVSKGNGCGLTWG